MKRSTLRTRQFSWPDEEDQEIDRADAKDVWLATGEMAKFLDAKAALLAAGYRVQRAEMVEVQPLWVFYLVRATAPPIRDADDFRHHIRDVMWQVRIYFRDTDMIIRFVDAHIVVSFLWPTRFSAEGRCDGWDEGRLKALLDRLP